jgi:hypothetical protein
MVCERGAQQAAIVYMGDGSGVGGKGCYCHGMLRAPFCFNSKLLVLDALKSSLWLHIALVLDTTSMLVGRLLWG